MNISTGKFVAIGIAVVALQACGAGADDSSSSGEPPDRVVVLLDDVDETVLGQAFDYPTTGTPQVTTSIITLQPGEETGWHHHNTPLMGYIMEGSLKVDYGDDGIRVYETGDALIEAIGTSHNGSTEGDSPVQLLVVNIGAAGIDNTETD